MFDPREWLIKKYLESDAEFKPFWFALISWVAQMFWMIVILGIFAFIAGFSSRFFK